MRERAFPEEPEMHERWRERASGESTYRYFSHSGRPEVVEYRRLTEEWLSHYPEEHLRKFLRRFQGNDSQVHEAAFFELFLHERLRVLCDKIEVEGAIGDSGKCADFVLHYADGSAVAVEALSLEPIERAEDPNVELVNEWIRQLRSADFMIWLGESEGQLTSAPKKREVQGWARDVLSQYSWEEAYNFAQRTGNRLIPVKPLELDGWVTQAELWVNPPNERIKRECLGVFAGQGFGYYDLPATVRERIRDKIKRKKVSRGSTPFILAVNINDRMLHPADEELEVLHGFKHRIRFRIATGGGPPVDPDPQSVFSPDGTEGVWSTPDNKAQYDRCAAIWFFHQVGIVHPRGRRSALYLNPFVSHGYRMKAFSHSVPADIALPD